MKLKYKDQVYDLKINKDNNVFFIEINHKKIKIFSDSDGSLYGFVDNYKYPIYKAETQKFIYIYALGKYYKFEKIDYSHQNSFEDIINIDTEEIYAPTPGTIIKILVNNDEKVIPGKAILTIESMKMENTIYSSIEGTIKEINIKEGEKVNTDKLLILIKK